VNPHPDLHDADLVEGLAMIPGLYTYAATAVVAGSLAFGAGWQTQAWRYEGQIASLHAQRAKDSADARQQALEAAELTRRAQKAINDKHQGVLNEARTREALLRTEADHLRRVSDGLRDQNADAARRLIAAPPAAVLEHAIALGVVFDDCRAAYGELVPKADGHAGDVRAHREAWPVMGWQ